MPLAAREKMRSYRERLKRKNPEKYEEQRKKSIARIKSKKKKLSELNPAEAEAKREEQRKEKGISRQRRQDMKKASPSEDMCSATAADNNLKSETTEDKKLKKLKSKLKSSLRQTNKFNTEIKKLKTKVERYKKGIQKSLNIIKARIEVLESALKASFSGCINHSEKQQLKKVTHISKN